MIVVKLVEKLADYYTAC